MANQDIDRLSSAHFSNNLVLVDLSTNCLRFVPNEIYLLSKLRVLRLANNFIEEVSQSVGNLRSLEEFNLAENRLDGIPSEIGLCT